MAFKLLLLSLLSIVVVNAYKLNDFKGYNATRDQFPYLAAVRNSKGHSCSAVVLSDRDLLVVSSCDFDIYFDVVVGMDASNDIYDPSHPKQLHNVRAVKKSGDYYGVNSKKKHLAILQLEKPINLKKHSLTPARLLTEVPDGHTEGVYAGWPAETTDTTMKYETVQLISKVECTEKMKDACTGVLHDFSLDGNICGKETDYQIPPEFRSSPLDLHLGDNKVAALVHYIRHRGGCPLLFTLVEAYKEFIDFHVPNVEWVKS